MPEDQSRTSYDFTLAEAPAFRQAVLEVQGKVNELNAMIRLVVSQNGLPEGNWQVKSDLTGLLRVPQPQSPTT